MGNMGELNEEAASLLKAYQTLLNSYLQFTKDHQLAPWSLDLNKQCLFQAIYVMAFHFLMQYLSL